MAQNVVEVILRARDEATASLKKLDGTLAGLTISIAAVSAATTAIGAGLLRVASESARSSAELLRVSQQTGETVENLSRLKFAADQSETSLEAVTTGLRFLARQQDAARRGNEEAVKLFRQLGIESKGLKEGLIGSTETLIELANRFQATESPVARTAAAIRLFGRSAGPDLVPFLVQGGDAVRGLLEQSDALRATISRTAAVLGDDYTDAITKIKAQTEGAKAAIAEALLPTLIEAAEKVSAVATQVARFVSQNRSLITAVFELAAKLALPATALTVLAGGFVTARIALAAFGVQLSALSAAGGAIGLAVAALAGLATAFVLVRAEANKKFSIGDIDTTNFVEASDRLTELMETRRQLREELAKTQSLPSLDELGEPPVGLETFATDVLGIWAGNLGIVVDKHKDLEGKLKDTEKSVSTLERSIGLVGPPKPSVAQGFDEIKDAVDGAAASLEELVAKGRLLEAVKLEEFSQKLAGAVEKVKAIAAIPVQGLRLVLQTEGLEAAFSLAQDIKRTIGEIPDPIAIRFKRTGEAFSKEELELIAKGSNEAEIEIERRGKALLSEDEERLIRSERSPIDAEIEITRRGKELLSEDEKKLIRETTKKIVIIFESRFDPELEAKLLLLKEFKAEIDLKVNDKDLLDLIEALERANVDVEKFIDTLIRLKVSADSVFAGIAGGIEAGLATLGEALNPMRVAFDGMVTAFDGFAKAIDETLTTALDGLFFNSNKAFKTLGDIFIGLGKAVEQLVKQIIIVTVKALILKAVFAALGISEGGSVAGAITGHARGGEVQGRRTYSAMRQGGTAIAAYVRRAALATGGMIAGFSGSPIYAAAGVYTTADGIRVPGGTQAFDRVPALLAPGEAVLPTIGGLEPAALLSSLARLDQNLTGFLRDRRNTGQGKAGGITIHQHIQTYGIDDYRRDVRDGNLARETARATELGR